MAIALLAAACANGDGKLGAGDELLIADTLTGERCRLARTRVSGAGQVTESNVLCAGWEERSGRFWQLSGVGDLRAQDILADDDLPVFQGRYVEGHTLDQVGDYEAAVQMFDSALDIFRSDADPMWTAFTYEWLAPLEAG